jgi:hypothetical protein
MLFRRALYYWQFTAAVLLPVCVIVMRALYGSPSGWDFVVHLILGGILGVALLAVAGLTAARKSVRVSRAVSVRDAIALSLWHAVIIAYAVVDHPALAGLVVILGVAAFWNAAMQLFTETRERVRSAFLLPAFPVDAGHYDATTPTETGEHRVIVIEQGKEPRER